MSKWPEDCPLRHLFQPGGWKSTLSCPFIPFFEREPLFWLLPRGIFGTFGFQSCIWVFKMWGKRNFSKGSQFGHFPRNFVSLLFRIYFFWSKQFQILTLDGGPQHLIHVNLVCFNLDKGFCNFVDRHIYCQIYPDTFKTQYIPWWMFFKAVYHIWKSVFSVL